MGHDLDDELRATKHKLNNLYRNYDYKNIMKESKKIIERENKIGHDFDEERNENHIPHID